MKTNPWTCKLKDLNGEKIKGSFYEKELLLSIILMSYYPEPHSHMRYNLEKKIPHATTLIHVNQYNADKQNLEKKKLEELINNVR